MTFCLHSPSVKTMSVTKIINQLKAENKSNNYIVTFLEVMLEDPDLSENDINLVKNEIAKLLNPRLNKRQAS